MKLPRTLIVAFAGGAAAATLLALARAATRSSPEAMHTSLADTVTALSQTLAIGFGVLVLAGAYALRRREHRVGMLLVGGSLVLAAAIARPICEHFLFTDLHDYLAVLDGRRWLGRLDTTGAVAIAAGIVFLGEHTERVRNLAVPLFVLAIAAHPPLAIADGLADRLGDEVGRGTVWQAALAYGAIQVAFAGVALAALRASE